MNASLDGAGLEARLCEALSFGEQHVELELLDDDAALAALLKRGCFQLERAKRSRARWRVERRGEHQLVLIDARDKGSEKLALIGKAGPGMPAFVEDTVNYIGAIAALPAPATPMTLVIEGLTADNAGAVRSALEYKLGAPLKPTVRIDTFGVLYGTFDDGEGAAAALHDLRDGAVVLELVSGSRSSRAAGYTIRLRVKATNGTTGAPEGD